MKRRTPMSAKILAHPDTPAPELARMLGTTAAYVHNVRSRLASRWRGARLAAAKHSARVEARRALGGERVELRRPAMFGDDAVTAHMTRLVVELGRPRAAELLAAILADMNAIEERAR